MDQPRAVPVHASSPRTRPPGLKGGPRSGDPEGPSQDKRLRVCEIQPADSRTESKALPRLKCISKLCPAAAGASENPENATAEIPSDNPRASRAENASGVDRARRKSSSKRFATPETADASRRRERTPRQQPQPSDGSESSQDQSARLRIRSNSRGGITAGSNLLADPGPARIERRIGDNIRPKPRDKFAKILEGSNRTVKSLNQKMLSIARTMTPAWSLRLLGVSCGSVVCAWGLLLVFSTLGGASHDTGVGNFGIRNLGSQIEDAEGAKCPWACNCGGQELDCSHRALTQVPGDLAAPLLAEKL